MPAGRQKQKPNTRSSQLYKPGVGVPYITPKAARRGSKYKQVYQPLGQQYLLQQQRAKAEHSDDDEWIDLSGGGDQGQHSMDDLETISHLTVKICRS